MHLKQVLTKAFQKGEFLLGPFALDAQGTNRWVTGQLCATYFDYKSRLLLVVKQFEVAVQLPRGS